MPRVELILIEDAGGPTVRDWPLGPRRSIRTSIAAIAAALEDASKSRNDAVLLWDPSLGQPEPAVIAELTTRTAEVHHAGLSLGTARKPRSVDFVQPLWMHNCDAPAEIESTSWRISPRACLVRREVLVQLDGLCGDFESLEMAALELGHRWLRRGVFVRHTPALLPRKLSILTSPQASLHDELLFARRTAGMNWARWAAGRGVLTGAWSATEVARVWSRVAAASAPRRQTFRRPCPTTRRIGGERVTVLVPTVERYPYLRVLLSQLREQTVAPHEVIVVDQTPPEARDPSIPGQYADLPLRWMVLERAGQCTSRNAGLLASTGDHVLFIDDDDEIKPTLIQKHLECLARYDVEVSSGVAHEVGVDELPEAFRFTRASDVFPTNNTMVRRSILQRTGLFDLAYDRQQRADRDLGMRVHISGALMVLEPEIDVLHHHAPRGGLRTHKARVITYASSRRDLWQRQLPSPSEIYLGKRYFGDDRVREFVWQRTLGTLSSHGGMGERAAKGAIGLAMLPDTLGKLRSIRASADELLRHHPTIAELSG